jgi:hypothetical protein
MVSLLDMTKDRPEYSEKEIAKRRDETCAAL